MANPRFVIKAVISGQRLNINVPLTVAGTLNYIGVEAKCTSEWDDCTVICYIINAEGNLLQLSLTYDKERDIYFFPTSQRLTLIAGEWSIYFIGVKAVDGEVAYRVTTEPRNFTIAYNELYSSVPQEQIPLYEQAIAIAEDAKQTADDLYQKYLDGDLKGDKGDTGDPARIGFVQASVGTSTTNPRCTVTTTEDPEGTYNMQFAFNGIKGAKGDKGDTGDKGDKGDTGDVIDDYVLVQDTEPTSPTNKMWLKPAASGDPVMIPSVEDLVGIIRSIDIINGTHQITLTDFDTPFSHNGVTAEYDNGRLKLYGNCTTIFYLLCLNGQIAWKGSSSPYAETTNIADTYVVRVSASGNVSDGYIPEVRWTQGLFVDGTNCINGDYILTDTGISVALRIPKRNFGTQENPTYIDLHLDYFEEKASAEDADQIVQDIDAINDEIDDINDEITAVNGEITKIDNETRHSINAMNGTRQITLTDFSTPYTHNGVTAEYDNGRLKLYGNCTTIFYLLCLNGQIAWKGSSSSYAETTDASNTYIVRVTASGNISEGYVPEVRWTNGYFSAGTNCVNGDYIYTDSGMSIGLRIPKINFGTQESPTYIDLHLDYFEEKVGVAQIKDIIQIIQSSNTTDDRSAEIVSMLNTYKHCKLGVGDFYVSTVQMPKNTMLEGCGAGTRVILINNETGPCVRMNDFCIVKNIAFYGSLLPVTINSVVGQRHGIGWIGDFTTSADRELQPKQGTISDCIFKNFNGGAITCDDTGPRVDCGMNVVNCQIYGCDAGINIAYRSEFNRFTNIDVYQCYYGCVNNGGNNMFVNCGFSDNKVGFIIKTVDGSGRPLSNDGHGSAVACVFNHIDRDDVTLGKGDAIHLEGMGSGFIFADCQVFYGTIYVKNSVGVVFKGFNIGRLKDNQGEYTAFTITIETDDGTDYHRTFFEGCIFAATPRVIYNNINGSANTVWDNCYIRNGTPVDKSAT